MSSELIVQLTDLHVQVGADAERAAERVVRAVELVGRLRPAPVAVLLTGDLTNDEGDGNVDRLVELLAPLLDLGVPVAPMVGNHDDRAALREALGGLTGVAQLGDERHLQYELRAGESFRVLALDTQHTGHADGKHCDTRYAWLAARLAEDSETPTILAMHHPPVATGMPAFDAIGMRADHAARLQTLIAGAGNVELVACGHVHRAWTGTVGGVPVFGCPSVYLPARPDYVEREAIELVEGPVGIGVHVRCADGTLASHVRMIGPVPNVVTSA